MVQDKEGRQRPAALTLPVISDAQGGATACSTAERAAAHERHGRCGELSVEVDNLNHLRAYAPVLIPLTPSCLFQPCVSEKKFPDSTDDFFDAISHWFSVVIATRARKLDAEATPNPLYQ